MGLVTFLTTVLTSEAYEPIHPPDAIQNNLPIEKQRVVFFLEYPMTLILALHSIGAIDPNTVVKVIKEVTEEDKRRQALMDARPPLDEILNLHDFEVSSLLVLNTISKWLISSNQAVAKAVLPAKAWAYYSSASDDEITIRENRAAFQRYVNLRSILRLSWLG